MFPPHERQTMMMKGWLFKKENTHKCVNDLCFFFKTSYKLLGIHTNFRNGDTS